MPATEEYYDLGSFTSQATTTSPHAQTWFDRGLVWAYSFNHEEAIRCFQQVIAHDPTCVMGYWGIAYASGPHYNKPWAAFDAAELRNSIKTGYSASRTADAYQATATPRERAWSKLSSTGFPPIKSLTTLMPLIKAMPTRCGAFTKTSETAISTWSPYLRTR